MRVYIAGPMRGVPEFNFPAFDEAATELRAVGHMVVSPADHDREQGFDPAGMTGNEDLASVGFDLRDALAWDLAQVAKADAVWLLPGWERSSGARAEHALAVALGLQAATVGTPWVPAASIASASAGGEVRVTDPRTGGEKGSKLARFDLIPTDALWALAEHYGRGAMKYADRNWERGYAWHLSYASLLRHLTAWWGGQDFDDETGSSHLTAVAWHAFALYHFQHATHLPPDLDDRPTSAVAS